MTPPRRRRGLSGEERRLWAEVAASVRPLPGRAPPLGPEPAVTLPEAAAAPPARSAPPAPRPAIPAASRLPPLAPLERRAARALGRGRLGAEATLDLHGMTQAEAHRRLAGFLRGAQAAGHGLVLVVTGHGGLGGSGERGVLRRTVPLWLGLPELRPVVLGFQEAGPRQGGAGAFFVRLRRPRA